MVFESGAALCVCREGEYGCYEAIVGFKGVGGGDEGDFYKLSDYPFSRCLRSLVSMSEEYTNDLGSSDFVSGGESTEMKMTGLWAAPRNLYF